MGGFWIDRKGKLVECKVPKNNYAVPKTKRLRKKKFWLFCEDCRAWFKRYEKGYGTLNNGKHVCNTCLIKRVRLTRYAFIKKGEH